MVLPEALERLRANGTLKDPPGAEIARACGGGEPLSAAMGRHPDRFPADDVALVEAAESTGRLDGILDRLAEFSSERRNVRRQLFTDNLYNLLLIHFCAALVPIGLSGGKLSMGEWFLWLLVILGPLYACGFVLRRMARTAKGEQRLQRVAEAIPGFGAAARHRRRARFARVLEAAYEAGIPLDRAVSLSGRAVRSGAADMASVALGSGTKLTAALAGTELVSHEALRDLSTAEEAGEISAALRRVVAEETSAADAALQRSMTALSKGVYILIALGVLWYAFTILGPVRKLYGG